RKLTCLESIPTQNTGVGVVVMVNQPLPKNETVESSRKNLGRLPACILPSPQCYNSAAKTLIPFLHRRHRMHRRIVTLLAIAPALCISTLALREFAIAQEHAQHTAAANAKPATLMTVYGDWHHPR